MQTTIPTENGSHVLNNIRMAMPLSIALSFLGGCGGGGGASADTAPTPTTLSIGGSVTGLRSGSFVTLEDLSASSTTTLDVAANGAFTMPGSRAQGASYAVGIIKQPSSQYCTASNASGTVGTASIANIAVSCVDQIWTWVGGSNANNSVGVYGAQGISGSANVPGGRSGSGTSRDATGGLWMFGGFGFGSSGAPYYINDLWRFSPSSKQWTWVSGSSTTNAASDFGIKGVAAASNMPGARQQPATWSDAAGNLWVFGGAAQGTVGTNDLWMYSPSTGLWTWTAGSAAPGPAGVYGTLGVSDSSTSPGGRSQAATWVDRSGNLWLFGGYGFDANGSAQDLNDLWRFSPVSGLWTWMGGASTVEATGSFGSKGVAAATNVPGARRAAASWTDSSGNMWLFGGASASGQLNDLWKYSPNTNQWVWVSGSSSVNDSGNFGTRGVPAATNMPGARQLSAAWIDAHDNLWLYGGYGLFGGHEYSDLWMYSTSTGGWICMNGVDGVAYANWGAQGVAAGANTPGNRRDMAAWIDNAGGVWIFGGTGVAANGQEWTTFSDLWFFNSSM